MIKSYLNRTVDPAIQAECEIMEYQNLSQELCKKSHDLKSEFKVRSSKFKESTIKLRVKNEELRVLSGIHTSMIINQHLALKAPRYIVFIIHHSM